MGSLADGFNFVEKPTDEKKKRFRKRRGETKWRIDDFTEGVEAWLDVLSKPNLKALWEAITDDVRTLRNDVAHNDPTLDLMHDARTRMQKAALWSSTDTFLGQPLVQAVLEELGEANPGDLLANLLVEVRRRLVFDEAGHLP